MLGVAGGETSDADNATESNEKTDVSESDIKKSTILSKKKAILPRIRRPNNLKRFQVYAKLKIDLYKFEFI